MTAYYDIMTELQTLLDADISINSVTEGMTHEIATRKQTMYANAHVDVTDYIDMGKTSRFNITITCMDVENIQKETITDHFKGNNNRHDILNTMMAVHVRLAAQLRRGSITESGYKLQNNPNPEKFVKRFEDGVTGWFATYQIDVINSITIC